MPKVFISYRRHDAGYVAAVLNEKLEERFGTESVFYDVDNIPLGVDFREYIGNAVGKCDVLLVIISDNWAEAVDKRGRRRLDDPKDFVRVEIEAALNRKIPIVPVLVQEAELPAADALPPSIQEIVFRNATELRQGPDFRAHLARLINGLDVTTRMTRSDDTAVQKADPPPVKKKKTARGKKPDDKPEARTSVNALEDSDPIARQVGRSELLNEVNQVIGDFKDPQLFVGKEIPSEKLVNAIDGFAFGVSHEDALLLYDNTLFGGAKEGALLTTTGVYWRSNMGDPRGEFAYDRIESVQSREGVLFADVLINGQAMQVAVGNDRNKIAKMISDVIVRIKTRLGV